MSGDDTQDANSEPGDPAIDIIAAGLPGMRPHVTAADERQLAQDIERIVLRLRHSPQYVERVKEMLGLNWDSKGI